VISLTGLEDVPENLPTDLTIQTQGFPIGWVVPFLNPTIITAMDGLLTADIRVGGTQGAPDLTGSASVSRGSITLPNTRVRYSDIEIRTRLSGRNMLIDQAELRSGGGSLSASGAIEFISLTRQEYDLKIDAENFRAIHTDTYRGTIGGKFELGGTSEAPTLSGNLLLGPMDVFLTEELTAEELEYVRLTPRDLQVLESRFGYRISAADTTMFDFYQALRMDLSVEVDRDVWLRSAKAPQWMWSSTDGSM
jgi:translocation and assembly module TamB